MTLQYIAPIVLILYLTLMYKTMGGESWSGFWLTQGENNQSPVDAKDQVGLVLKFIGVFWNLQNTKDT